MQETTAIEVFVGMDYHKDSVQVCVLDRQGRVRGNRQVPNAAHAILGCVAPGERVRRAAMEVGTGAADLAEELVEQAGWCVELAHPGYVARMKGSPDKSDFSDARLLADLTRVGYLPRVWLAPPWIRELRRLVRYRQQQVNRRRDAKLRIAALLRDHRWRSPEGVRRWTKAWWCWLHEVVAPSLPTGSQWILGRHVAALEAVAGEIREAERVLTAVTRDDWMVHWLLGLSAVGPVTAWVLRAELGRVDRFDTGKSMARFCGVSPRNASSGQRQADAGLIRAGSPLLRTTLIELAHRLCRCERHWFDMKRRLRSEGKPGSVATAAVANRWVRRLYYELRDAQASRGKKQVVQATVGSAPGWA